MSTFDQNDPILFRPPMSDQDYLEELGYYDDEQRYPEWMERDPITGEVP